MRLRECMNSFFSHHHYLAMLPLVCFSFLCAGFIRGREGLFFSTDSLFWEFRNGRGHQVFSQLEWKILACGFYLISRPLDIVNYRQKWPFFVLFKTNVVNIFLKIIMKAYSCLVSNGNNRKNSTKFWVGKGRGGFYLKSSEGVAISKLFFYHY